MLEFRVMRTFILTSYAFAILCSATVGVPGNRQPTSEPRTITRPASATEDVSWSVQSTGIDTNLRGISAAGSVGADGAEQIAVWASGSDGVVLFSSDLGKSWKRLHVSGGDSLDFRSIVVFDAKHAYVMSSGEGEKSRIYETKDGGETWKLEFAGKNPSFFLDALACNSQCYALSDPVDGKFVLLSDHNDGTWSELPGDGMPDALPGEGAFAASGTALTVDNDRGLYFGTGGGKVARIFHSPDHGNTWTVTDTPIASGNASSGIFSIVSMPWVLIAVGGDYRAPNRPYHVAAYSGDGGKAWQLAAQQPGGYRSAVAALYSSALAVGPNGEDISDDFGVHWKHIGSLDLNAVFVLDIYNAWSVGANGTIARMVNKKQYSIKKNIVRTVPRRRSANDD
jgi:photosystem II stability/assembly factor-like uncharacterized protein